MGKIKFNSIRTKMLLGFIVITVLVLFVNLFMYTKLANVSAELKEVVEKDIVLNRADAELSSSFGVRLAAVRGYVMSGDATEKQNFEMYTEQAKKNNEMILEKSTSQEARNLIEQSVVWREYMQQNVFDVYDKGDQALALKNLNSHSAESLQLQQAFEKLAEKRQADIEQLISKISDEAHTQQMLLIISTIILVILSLLIGYWLSNKLTKPITAVSTRLKALSEGDLTQQPLLVKSRDESGELMETSNYLTNKFKEIIHSLNTVSENVSTNSNALSESSTEVYEGSVQIATTMHELAQGSEHQANGSIELSEMMEDFREKINFMGDEATRMAEHSNTVHNLTENGQQKMQSSTSQMQVIHNIIGESVEKVGKLENETSKIGILVKQITDVAEQTDLLALNASIEAARAGEHGKGFVVVATEVRKLAEQVDAAVADIATIIQGVEREVGEVSTSLSSGFVEVQKGTKQIEETYDTFEHIADSVDSMNKGIESTSSNIQKVQSEAIAINKTIENIVAVAQQSAAGVEETVATIEQTSTTMEGVSSRASELLQMVKLLDQEINQFKLT
ncbi:methyl-accepting chemotaxis protein [Kurthia senegalensis]|uniref:methyl-accepting chemotaxis protein n=1 Tax=Kurthia senegalensis TaxID=1033740 RepID=UPI00028841A3|nr:HAMP domain-containing methyl-accepting chemotaxis protein [Kurthia senegalensis]